MKPFTSITVPWEDWNAIAATAEKAEVPPLHGAKVLVSKWMPRGFLGHTHPDGSMTIVGPVTAEAE